MANTPWDPTQSNIISSWWYSNIYCIYIYINYYKYDIITIVIQANYLTNFFFLFNELPVGSQYIPLKLVISQRPNDFSKGMIQNNGVSKSNPPGRWWIFHTNWYFPIAKPIIYHLIISIPISCKWWQYHVNDGFTISNSHTNCWMKLSDNFHIFHLPSTLCSPSREGKHAFPPAWSPRSPLQQKPGDINRHLTTKAPSFITCSHVLALNPQVDN